MTSSGQRIDSRARRIGRVLMNSIRNVYVSQDLSYNASSVQNSYVGDVSMESILMPSRLACSGSNDNLASMIDQAGSESYHSIILG